MNVYVLVFITALVPSVLCQEYPYSSSGCPQGSSLTYAKVAGYAPLFPWKAPVLFKSSIGTAMTGECYNRCKRSPDCTGFVVDYGKSICYKVPSTLDINLTYSPSTSFFAQVCLPTPQNCTNKAWSVEHTPDYELIGLQHNVIPNINNRWACIAACFNQASTGGEPCLSANYYSEDKTCLLSSHNKWTDPDSFIPATRAGIDYLENQCFPALPVGSTCWHDPVYNQSFSRADLQYYNISQEECGRRCELEQYFRCRGYTWFEDYSKCLLHSDPAITAPGPSLLPPLLPTPYAIYQQPITCINLDVSCEMDAMRLTLDDPGFNGRLFVQGHSETCGAQGRGANVTELIIPLPNGLENKCNVIVAHAVGSINRTLASAVVVVQSHQLIQTVNDRVIKVTCLLTQSDKPVSNNVTINASFSIKEPGIQNEITGVGGDGAGTEAKAKMSIVEALTGREARDVKLGDLLQLRIELESPLNVNMVRAGHLVASSGLDSVLLLDWRGCPPQPALFPPLSTQGTSVLVGEFRAFRFPSSPLLMLSMVVTVCPTVCQPTDCGNGLISFGRRKRETEDFEEVPLHLFLTVHSPDHPPNASEILSASIGIPTDGSALEGQLCLSFIMAALVSLFWILLQCVLITICCCVIRRQKMKHADTVSLRHDFQPRHVTWADDNEIPSKQLRLSTPIQT